MKVAIINYNAGNVCSVQFALERLQVQPVITDDPEELMSADKVIFPGVGSAGAAMKNLSAKGLDKLIPSLTQPVLGICLGMQLFAETSEEDDVPCLGIIPGRVLKFRGEKVPHMGWNIVNGKSSLLLPECDPFFYYVHSYYVPVGRYTTAITDYGQQFSAIVKKNNFYGVQFHPEKSGKAGEELIQSFLSL
jgi:imidazole glycerol-phosphate synthase subunit HisH